MLADLFKAARGAAGRTLGVVYRPPPIHGFSLSGAGYRRGARASSARSTSANAEWSERYCRDDSHQFARRPELRSIMARGGGAVRWTGLYSAVGMSALFV